MSEKKSVGQKLQEKLGLQFKNGGTILDDEQLKSVDEFNEGYKIFLDKGKTERECVEYSVELLEKNGFTKFDANKKYVAGDKVYLNNRGKAMIIAVIGKEPIENGVKMVASHIDSPRIDLKARPLYEEAEMVLFKTHYYGGVKKYQWVAIPLELRGVIFKADGTKVNICIGDEENDPVFCINDLLPHLAKDQMGRNLREGIKGEELNVLVGSRPFKDDKVSEKVKLNILNILNEKYGIIEKDFIAAELEMVPAFNAKDIGFDRSLLGAYGQDDRVCAYTSLIATIECSNPAKTVVTVLADKEEIGSVGNTGLQGAFLRYFIADLAKPYGVEGRTVLSNSKCLSADVNAAFDPTFGDVHERKNSAYVNYGVVLTKYTGSGGKGGANDAHAEFVQEIRKMLDDNNVVWQTAELGKVDQGGGGTVAGFISNLDVDVIDVGVPVLSMHAPFEVVSKIDVYMTYKTYVAFYK